MSCIDGYELNSDGECILPCLYDNCVRFTYGCNGCACTADGEAYDCTDVRCIWQGVPSCLECASGYEWVNGSCQASTSVCGGIEYCDTLSN